jgi:hypothetical protein
LSSKEKKKEGDEKINLTEIELEKDKKDDI